MEEETAVHFFCDCLGFEQAERDRFAPWERLVSCR